MTERADAFTSTERFPCKLTFGSFFLRFVPMLTITCLIVLWIVYQLGLGLPLVLVLAVALAVGLTALSKYRFDRLWGTAELEVSAAGVTVVRRDSRVHLPWNRIRRLGKADLVTPRYMSVGTAGAKLVSGLVISTMRRPGQPALIGGDGLGSPPVAIVLPIYEKSWENGRIGAWIRAYRPDLLSVQ